MSDLLTPLLVLEQGKKAVLEPEALVDEDPTFKAGQEIRTRRRITLRGLVSLSDYMDPLKYPMLFLQIFFHKVLRWFVGPLLITNALVCCALSAHWFFECVLLAYAVFFLAGALGCAAEFLGIKARALIIPYYFGLVNLAATLGIIDFLRRKQVATWKPVRY
jgi:hypothetical protein